MQNKTFLALDGNALLHRAWHAIPPLTTQDGRVVNAVYGFTNVIEKMLNVYKPDFMAVAWDLPGGTFRHEEYTPYKAQREKKADELYAQIPMIQEVLLAYGIPSLSAKGFEADDILGTIAKMNEAKGGLDTLIVTGDLDSLQLVNERTKVVFFVKGLSEVKLYDEAAVKARYGLEPKRLIDLKTLIGDTSDNLPGVAGIGEKGAGELLKAYGSIDGILDAMKHEGLPERFAKKFIGQEKTVEQMRRLVTIVCDVPLPEFSYATSAMGPVDVEKLLPLLRGFEFKTLLKKYEHPAKGQGAALPAKAEIQAADQPPVKVEKTKKTKLANMKDLDLSQIGILIDEKKQDLFGGSIAFLLLIDGRQVYKVIDADATELKKVVELLQSADEIVGHDLKAMMHAFERAGVNAYEVLRSKKMFDTMVAAYLLAAGDRELSLPEVMNNILGQSMTESSSLTELAPFLLPLSTKLSKQLKEEKMLKLFEEVEMPLLPVLCAMETKGIEVDQKKLVDLSEDFAKTIDKLTKQIIKLAGREFNVNSPAQLADVLFVDLGLPTKGIKKTKTGFSTAQPELDKLVDEHEIIGLIEEYREVAKLKSTYSDALPTLIGKDGRIHSTFNQTVAATGRLSSSNPNLQNIPVRSELGREIRSAFVAQKGYKLLSCDYSQIELRLAAVMSKDESFLRAFKAGDDVHRHTAAEIYDIPEEQVTKAQREAAKAINFSILYGVGARALARRTHMGHEEAKAFIEKYFAVHPGIAAFIDSSKMKARVDGYVETMFGRRRYLPDIQSGMPQLVAASERMAMNMPIQGTNADIIKMAMIKIDEWIRGSSLRINMLLQVHDELVFEVHEDDLDKAKEELPKLMAGVVLLEIPLVVDAEVSKRWGETE